MLYGIEGQFGSGKTSLATFIAKQFCNISLKKVKNGESLSGNIIISNIKMDKTRIPNYYYFDDDKLLQVLRTCNLVNDVERYLYTELHKNGGGLLTYKRNKFSKFYLFFDEAGSIANNHIKLENHDIYTTYINQNRKNFEDIYIITAKGGETNKTLRSKVDWWYYVKPLFNFWIFKDIGVIRRQQKDDEGNVLMFSYIGRDQNGDDVVKQKPIDEYVGFFWKPNVWSFYDDLHKNIADGEKYKDIDYNLFTQILVGKPELQNIVQKEYIFEDIKNKLPLLQSKNDN